MTENGPQAILIRTIHIIDIVERGAGSREIDDRLTNDHSRQ